MALFDSREPTTVRDPGSTSAAGEVAVTLRVPARPTAIDPGSMVRWGRRRLPPTDSVALYGAIVGLGVVGAVEWPALALAAAAQVLVDRRVGAVERDLLAASGRN